MASPVLGATAIRPVERTWWESFKYFIYAPKEGAILTRTPKSWFLILSFYFVFYTCLATYWLLLYRIFYLTITEDSPKFTDLIGNNPGLGVRPQQPLAQVKVPFYYIAGNWNSGSAKSLEEESDAGHALRLEHYFNTTFDQGQNETVKCTPAELEAPREPGQKPCWIDRSMFGECGVKPFGYAASDLNPCVIIKVNKIFGFVPSMLGPEDVETDGLPDKLRVSIGETISPRRVYIDCQGAHPHDQEALEGKLRFYPDSQGLPIGYFPHQSKTMLAGPAVAVQFVGIPRGQLFYVQCKVWHKSVVHDTKNSIGSVRFGIMIDQGEAE